MLSDSSDEEYLEHLKEATDLDFFKNSLYDGEGGCVQEEIKVEIIPSLRTKEEYDQFRLFNVTPQFQKYVGNALGEKMEKYLKDNLTEYTQDRKKKKKILNCIKLLSTSKYSLDVESEEIEIIEKRRKIKNKRLSISESDFKSIVITGEEILSKKGTEYWSNRSKAPVYSYIESNEGTLKYVEPEFK